MHTKLKMLEGPISQRNKEVFGKIDNILQRLEKEINKLDDTANLRALNECEVARLGALQSNHRRWNITKGQVLRQYTKLKISLTSIKISNTFMH